MSNASALAGLLRDGVAADIWYDASDHGDTEVAEQIEDFQQEIESAACLLDHYDELFTMVREFVLHHKQGGAISDTVDAADLLLNTLTKEQS